MMIDMTTVRPDARDFPDGLSYVLALRIYIARTAAKTAKTATSLGDPGTPGRRYA